MKAMKFGDNAAVIGGKRVPYSLLGAGAAILGAFLIWKQMGQGGGLSLGQQLAGLGDLGGGGGGGLDLGGVDLGGGGTMPSIPVYATGTPAPIYGPVYAMDTSGTAALSAGGGGFTKASDVLPASSTSAVAGAAAAVAAGAASISKPRPASPTSPVIWTRTGPRTPTPTGNTGGSYTPIGTGAGLVA